MITRYALTERLLYVLLIVMFLVNISGLVLAAKTLQKVESNQDTLLCIVHGPSDRSILTNQAKISAFIDDCVRANQ